MIILTRRTCKTFAWTYFEPKPRPLLRYLTFIYSLMVTTVSQNWHARLMLSLKFCNYGSEIWNLSKQWLFKLFLKDLTSILKIFSPKCFFVVASVMFYFGSRSTLLTWYCSQVAIWCKSEKKVPITEQNISMKNFFRKCDHGFGYIYWRNR